jgi:hypothetical protein
MIDPDHRRGAEPAIGTAARRRRSAHRPAARWPCIYHAVACGEAA